jgi:hypothetical protein
MGSYVHDTFISSVNNIHLVNGGFPITFKAEQIECYPLEMDVTMMKLAEGVLNHIICKTDFIDSIQEIKLLRVNPWIKVSVYAWLAVIISTHMIQLIFQVQLVAPNSKEAHIVGIILFSWGAIPSLFYLKHYYKLLCLLPR